MEKLIVGTRFPQSQPPCQSQFFGLQSGANVQVCVKNLALRYNQLQGETK